MEEIDLKELLSLFWSKIFQIIVITLIIAGIGIIYTYGFTTPKYSSSTTLVLTGSEQSTGTDNTNSITTTDVTLNSKLISTYTRLVKSDRVVRNVISNLALDMDEEELKNSVSVTTTNDTEFIEISVENADPVLATKIANEVSKVLIENVKEFYKAENVHVVDLAEIPQAPYNVNHVKDAVIFAFIGIVVAVLYVLVLNMLDTSVKSEDDIEKITGLRVLVSLPLYETNTPRNKRGGRR